MTRGKRGGCFPGISVWLGAFLSFLLSFQPSYFCTCFAFPGPHFQTSSKLKSSTAKHC